MLRLKPGDELIKTLSNYAFAEQLEAASIISAVGSLTVCIIRFANQEEHVTHEGHFEVVSLSGMLSTTAHHLHICISDEKGRVIGGHLVGGIVYTTLELSIMSYNDLRFERNPCEKSGYDELEIFEKHSTEEKNSKKASN